MRPHLPELGSQHELTEDWDFPVIDLNSYSNWPFRYNLRETAAVGNQPGVDYPEFQGHADINNPELDKLPKGTVVQFNRYHVSNSGDDEITLEVVKCPNPYLIPKSKGGKGKGKMRFYLSLASVNTLPL